MLMEVAATPLVRIDVLINTLMADLDVPLAFEPARNLFRTPILTKLTLDKCPGRRRNADGDVVEFAFFSSVLRLFGTIATPASVALHFARDGRRVNSDLKGDLKL